MAILPIHNKTENNKRTALLAVTGGVALGGKEIYNTRVNSKKQVENFKYIVKHLTLDKSQEVRREKLYEDILTKARNIDSLVSGSNYEQRELDSINYLKNSRKEAIKRNKQLFRDEIKRIKKYAPFKIAAKSIGGALIGLAASYIISRFKN